jgi:WD40 repeat protein
MKKGKWFIALWIMALVTACSPSSPANKVLATESLPPTRQITPSQVSAATQRPSPTFTPTLRALPLHEFERRCPDLMDSLPVGFLTEGILFLREYQDMNFKDVILTSQDEHLRSSPYLQNEFYEISPDGKWIIFIQNGNLNILSYDRKKQFSYPWKDKWDDVQAWLNPDQIVIKYQTKSDAVDVLDLMTGKIEVISPGFTDRYIYDRELSHWPVWKLVPDPSLIRVAYMRDHGNGEFPPGLVLVSLENGQTVWELRRFSPGDRHIPVWSPDGEWMAVATDDWSQEDNAFHSEIYTVNRDGQAVNWLDMKSEKGGLFGNELKWSPDGRYMAFYGESLYLIDTLTKQAFDLCVPINEFLPPFNIMTWSPDSKQIVIEQSDGGVVIIDIEKNESASVVGDINIRPFGWLKSP